MFLNNLSTCKHIVSYSFVYPLVLLIYTAFLTLLSSKFSRSILCIDVYLAVFIQLSFVNESHQSNMKVVQSGQCPFL